MAVTIRAIIVREMNDASGTRSIIIYINVLDQCEM